MSHWGTSDSGILRKNKVDENLDELLVFGYSCKIFRDDEKAIYVDQGKHLIPWMGDETLKIDRYDGRGALSDLRQYEANREGYDVLRWMGLSESEKKLEELCDSERYYSLEINEEEEEMYKEEVAKRQKTTAIAFNYDNPEESTETPPKEEMKDGIPTVPEKEEEDEPYKPSPVLDVPININIPQTVKVYARIEKTALFVCRQGPQMEILIKAKQADNPQFSFLTVNDPLYKFYRHVYSSFKNGRYQPQCEKKQEEPGPDEHQDDDHDYLHPSLLSASAKLAAPPLPKNPPIPSVPYRPSADCAYSQLVNRIQGAGLNNASQSEQSIAGQGVVIGQQGVTTAQVGAVATQQADNLTQMTMEQQYHHYYYVQQFYEYWRHAVISGEQGAAYASLPTDFSQLDPNMQSYIHQMAWAQFVQHYQKQMQEAQEVQAKANNNSYAQIVSNLNKDGVNPYTASVPQLPPPEPKTDQPQPVAVEVTVVKPEEVKKPLLSLAAAYASGSESDSESSDSGSESDSVEGSEAKETKEEIEVYRVPAGEAQTVIDKMAEYVSKNGEAFEEIIKEKGDQRFDFLKDGHEFNKYYRAKLRELKGEPVIKEIKKISKKPPKPKKVIAPVCFSIKKPKEDTPKEIKSALPMEDSSEEEGYLDIIPKSPQNNAATNGSNVASQKMPLAPKIGPLIYNLATYVLPQPKIAQVEEVNIEQVNDRLSPQKEKLSSKRRSESPGMHRRARRNSRSPRRRSRSPTSSPRRVRRSHTPKKRSASPRTSHVASKRSKSRSKTPGKKSPARNKLSPTRNQLSPIKERATPVRNKKSPVIDMFEADGDSGGGGARREVNGMLENDDPILEMLELEVEKSAEEKAADAKERARQLERKRKAAMFLKLKSAETSVPATLTVPGKKEKSSPVKSVKSEKSTRSSRSSPTASSRSSRKNSEDAVKVARAKTSRSRTEEKSKIDEKSASRNESRSKSKESGRSSRRSRSKDRKKDSKKRKKSKEKDTIGNKDKDDEKKVKKEKKKKSHKRKHSKSKDHEPKPRKKSRKHKRSRSPSKSRSISIAQSISSRSKTRSRSRSVQSHISIASS